MLAVLVSLPVSWNIGPHGKPTQWFWGPFRTRKGGRVLRSWTPTEPEVFTGQQIKAMVTSDP